MSESRRVRASVLILCVLLLVFAARFYWSGAPSGATALGQVSWFASEEERDRAARRARIERWRRENAAWIVATQELRRRLGQDARIGGWKQGSESPSSCVDPLEKDLYRVRGWIEPTDRKRSGAFILEMRYIGDGEWRCERFVLNWDY